MGRCYGVIISELATRFRSSSTAGSCQQKNLAAAAPMGDHMNIGLVVLNAGKTVVQCTGAGELLLGVPSHQALGQSIHHLLQKRVDDFGSAAALNSLVNRIADPAPEPLDSEVVFRRPNYRHLKVTVFPLAAGHENHGTGMLVRDITLDVGKDDFISILSHELLNPITSVMGYSDLLKNTPLDQTQRDWLETVHSSGQRLADLVEDLLEVAELERGDPLEPQEIFPLNRAMDEVLGNTKLRAGFGQLEVKLDPHLPMVKTSRKSLGTILLNLLRNAINYAPSGSKVTISARHEEHLNRVVVSVKDQGQGIAQTDADSVFTPFFQCRQPAGPSTSATSLCLYIAKSLVEALGGEIWLESDSREGATFHFSLESAAQNAEWVQPTELTVTTGCE